MLSSMRMDDDDLYSGYGASSPYDPQYQEDILHKMLTGNGQIPKQAMAMPMRLGTGYREGSTMHLKSALATRRLTTASSGTARPMTAVRGAGYTSGKSKLDSFSQATAGPSPTTAKEETSAEEKIKKMELKIMSLVESSYKVQKTDKRLALEKAKEASSKERTLARMQEQTGFTENRNVDLTFSVLFNLAQQYESCGLLQEALNVYQAITKNRVFSNASRLKINMGNIHARLGQFQRAVKLYRMALDQVPSAHKDLRLKIMHNIGLLFVKMGQYQDACMSFEFIMQEKPNFKTGLHMAICYMVVKDVEKLRRSFRLLLEVNLDIDDEEKYATSNDEIGSNLYLEGIRNDELRKVEREMQQQAEKSILSAVKLVARVLDDGFSWCIETLKGSNYSNLAGELEVNQANVFLRQRDIPSAMASFHALTESPKTASAAATNLSFLSYLQGDISGAEEWAEKARQTDSYNADAFVNLGSCAFAHGEFDKARSYFMCALENDPSCFCALFNLGLTHKRQGNLEDALESFLKLHSIVGTEPQVLYHIANLQELLGDFEQANEWYQQLLGYVPTDPGILQKVGDLHVSDRQQAFQFYFDSSRFYPSSLSAIEWLGAYYAEMQVPEKAIQHYERAVLAQPTEPRWPLLIASCLRRGGNHQEALRHYQAVLHKFPDNLECLRFLIRICTDLGMKTELAEYAKMLKKAEKARMVKERIDSSRPGSRKSVGSSRGGSAASLAGFNDQTNKAMPSTSTHYPIQDHSSTRPHTSGRNIADDILDEDIENDLLPE
ncbi:intraflagellar transport protein 88 homolog isoform X2 [Neocloeon triangulifer]|uniref:intraflagellar transport protein 88 homolog isoform X2 n=1 Tax=Neocloeon triangulifer TaxID=2078957 RepID=UPI00286EE65A|nr:intraflagellar transport protein 88 homolog isoform X2 [Neocloeon triangulifer]